MLTLSAAKPKPRIHRFTGSSPGNTIGPRSGRDLARPDRGDMCAYQFSVWILPPGFVTQSTMPVPPDGTLVERLMSLGSPNCVKAPGALDAQLVPLWSHPVEEHTTLLELFAPSAVTVTQNEPAET